jgi:hypothetical protein
VWLTVGNGGWIKAEGAELPGALYVRLRLDSTGRWRTSQIFLEGDDHLVAEDLRRLPMAAIEARAAGPELRPQLVERVKSASPPLATLASYFATNFGSQAKHWVADAFRSQTLGSPLPKVERKADRHAPPDEPPSLTAPNGARLTDEFLQQVSRAYDAAVARNEWPAKVLAEQTGVTVHAVRKWIYTARKRGIMLPGRQGTVS